MSLNIYIYIIIIIISGSSSSISLLLLLLLLVVVVVFIFFLWRSTCACFRSAVHEALEVSSDWVCFCLDAQAPSGLKSMPVPDSSLSQSPLSLSVRLSSHCSLTRCKGSDRLEGARQ